MFRDSIIDYWQGEHDELNIDIATIDRSIEKVKEEKVRVVELTKQRDDFLRRRFVRLFVCINTFV